MMYHSQETVEFRQEHVAPFTEMMITWNGDRPGGDMGVYVSVYLDEWTSWQLYASWGGESQASYKAQEDSVRVYQDIVEVLDGKQATGFCIKVDRPMRLHVYTNGESQPLDTALDKPVCLPVEGLSQVALSHPRSTSLCSPTATAAVTRFLSQQAIDPVHFAGCVWDRGFDIYGNWVLNVAESAARLGPSWSAWVERLSGFEAIYERLLLGTPVVVSVRGPLPGSAQPYARGHLIVVTGFDPEAQEVLCMDPAFPTDAQTHVRYKLDDFLAAWARRGHVAYVFEKLTPNN